MTIRRLLPFFLCSVFIVLASSRCYWIDSSEALNRFPCYDLNSVGASMCCDEELRDFFISCDHGICMYNYSSGTQGFYDQGLSYWRDSCTDPTWRDVACLAMAPDVTTAQVRLNLCADGTYCPRNITYLNNTCCENDQGQQAANGGAQLSLSARSIGPVSTSGLITASSSYTSTGRSSLTSSTISVDVPTSSSASSLNGLLPPTTKPNSLASPTESSKGGGNEKNSVSNIATIVGSVAGALGVMVAIIFGINGWKKRCRSRHQQSADLTSHTTPRVSTATVGQASSNGF